VHQNVRFLSVAVVGENAIRSVTNLWRGPVVLSKQTLQVASRSRFHALMYEQCKIIILRRLWPRNQTPPWILPGTFLERRILIKNVRLCPPPAPVTNFGRTGNYHLSLCFSAWFDILTTVMSLFLPCRPSRKVPQARILSRYISDATLLLKSDPCRAAPSRPFQVLFRFCCRSSTVQR